VQLLKKLRILSTMRRSTWIFDVCSHSNAPIKSARSLFLLFNFQRTTALAVSAFRVRNPVSRGRSIGGSNGESRKIFGVPSISSLPRSEPHSEPPQALDTPAKVDPNDDARSTRRLGTRPALRTPKRCPKRSSTSAAGFASLAAGSP